MHIEFDHSYGLQSQSEVYHFGACLKGVEPSDHDSVLAQGWLATALSDGTPRWYQSRSTRCDLDKFNRRLVIDDAVILQDPLPLIEMDHIYSAYCYHKRYRKYFEVDSKLDWDIFMGYRVQDQLVAWSKLRRYSEQAIETALFVWDYRDPALKLGMQSLLHELTWAQRQGYRYVYLGPGYERMSRYKADVDGFEWWTGSHWSQDRDQYLALCDRDSKITHCRDLHGLSA